MANLNFNSVSEIARNESAIKALKGDKKEITEQVNTKKLESYTHLIQDLAVSGIKLVKRGSQQGLPKQVMKQIGDEMAEQGISPACIKRYKENTNGLLRVMPELLKHNDFGQVALALHNEGLSTENKIKEKAFGKADPIEALAKKIVELDAEERVRLDELVRAFEEAKAAEAEAAAQAEANADAINATLEALEDAAA